MSKRQITPALPLAGSTILVDRNYTCAVSDGLVVVQTAGAVVTLPPNPTIGTTLIEFSAEQTFSLSGGVNPLSGSDPLSIGGGSTFYAVFTAVGWLLSGLGQSAGKTAYTIPALFVDPLNSSLNAKDTNSGTDAAHPLATTTRANQLLANKFINFAGGLKFIGTPVTTRTGTFTGMQAIVPATNTRQRVTDAAVASWAADVGNFCVDTTGANNGVAAPIMHNVPGGTHQADLGRPVTQGGAAGAMTNGDTYAVKRGSNITLGNIVPLPLLGTGLPAGQASITYMSDDNSGVPLDLSTTTLAGLNFQDLFFLTSGPLGPNIEDWVGTTLTRCQYQDNVGTFVSHNLTFIITLNNCIFLNGCDTQLGSVFMNSGGCMFGQFTGVFLGVSGDTYFSSNITLSEQTLLGMGISAGIGAGIQIHDVPFTAHALQIFDSQDLEGGLIWGSGNTGVGIALFPGASLTVSAANPPVLTGANGDYRFIGQNGGALVNSGRPWNEAGGVAGAAAALSWANFTGAAFSFQCHDFSTNAHIIGK